MMRLLDIPIFMSDSDIVPGGLHAVVRHQPLVPNGPIFSFRLTEVAHRSTQMISSMLLWHSANLPQRFLDPFRERLKGLAETDRSSFHIRVGEHEMIDQMGKGFSCDRASDDSDQDAVHRAEQTAWSTGGRDHVRVARPPRASLPRKDWSVFATHGGA